MKVDSPPPVVVITGVSSGLGRALAQEFTRRGAQVIGISRREPDIALAFWQKCDLRQPEERCAAAQAIIGRFGKIDLLINNAGCGAYATWAELSEADLRQLLELDFLAPIALAREFLPVLRSGRGSIINISSAAGKLPVPCMGAYCAAKAALSMFSATLALEVPEITVIDVAPGQINTGFSRRAFGNRPVPDSPGSGRTSPEKFARRIYRGWRRREKHICYPFGLSAAIWLVKNCLWGYYRRVSRKLWQLNEDK